MSDRDTARFMLTDVPEALGLLTRLPIRLTHAPRGAKAAWAYPLAGLAVGLIGALVAWATGALPAAVSAGLALAAMTFATGALHEDGLADTVDGLWGGWTPGQRLEIMKDSHIGTYGVLALIFALGLRWAALSAILSQTDPAVAIPFALIGTAILSRAPMVVLMHLLPNARQSGLSAHTGRPDQVTTLVALVLATVAGGITFGLALPAILALLVGTTALIAGIAMRKIKGQTGDILGATQQMSEIGIFILLAL